MTDDFEHNETLLDRDEREGLLAASAITREDLDELEHTNIEEGLDWLLRTRAKDILSESFLCLLHRKLFGKV